MTYTTYQEAKIDNPSKEILKARDDWEGCQELIGKFIANKHNSDGGEPYIGKGWFEICNPADYCMTVKQFLDAGHKFFEGDVYLCAEVGVFTIPEEKVIANNTAYDDDDMRYILKAKALEETKTYRYEKVTFNKASEAVAAWEDGELFTKVSHETYTKIETAPDVLTYLYRLYRRIEVTERELFIAEFNKTTDEHFAFDVSHVAGKLFDAGCRFVNGKG